MRALPTRVECLVAGGGPAGAACAGLLARRGASVLLVDDVRMRGTTPIETLLPSALQAFDRCGLGELVRGAAAVDRRRHGAKWDREEWAWRDDPRPGLCLRRPAFDLAVRSWASRSGAIVFEGGAVRTRGDGAFDVVARDGVHRVHARSLVLATGRNARLESFGVRVAEAGPETAALAFELPQGRAAADFATVAATRDGWCWTIGDGGERAVAVACFDASADGGTVRAVARRILAEAGALPAGAEPRLVGAVRATVQRRESSGDVCLLGDAAASLDPLASQGTEKALVGAEHLAALLAAALQSAGESLVPAASAAHAQWEEDLFLAHRRTTASFHARVQRFAEQPFWRARSTWSEPEVHVPVRLVRAANAMEHRVLVRQGGEVALTTGFGPDLRRARARLGRVALEPLLRAFASPTGIADGIAAAGQDARLFPLGTAAVRAALAEAIRIGLLVEG